MSTYYNVDVLAGAAIPADIVLRPCWVPVVDAPPAQSTNIWLVDPTLAIFPNATDVKLGTNYGRTGAEYKGTFSPGAGGNTYSRSRVTNA